MFTSARRLLSVMLIGIALLGVAMSVSAQTRPASPAAPAAASGRISGKATEKGSPVSFANVVVLGTKQGTMTDETGAFVIAGVPVGTYQVKLQAIGFVSQAVGVPKGYAPLVSGHLQVSEKGRQQSIGRGNAKRFLLQGSHGGMGEAVRTGSMP